MLPIAWNIQDSPFSRLWPLKVQHFSIHRETISCRTENTICLVDGLQEHPDLTSVNRCKNKGFWHQEVCNNQPHSLPFQYKRSLNSTSGKMVFWGTGPPSSWSAGFLNKVVILCRNNFSLDLVACHAASSMSLDSVKTESRQLMKLHIHPWWAGTSAKDLPHGPAGHCVSPHKCGLPAHSLASWSTPRLPISQLDPG